IVAEILARRRHQQRSFAEQRQRIGNVRRAATAPLVHRIDEETQADAAQMFRQEMIGELPGKRHQVVVRDRTSHNDVHTISSSFKIKRSTTEVTEKIPRFVLSVSSVSSVVKPYFMYFPMIGSSSFFVFSGTCSGLVIIAVASASLHV